MDFGSLSSEKSQTSSLIIGYYNSVYYHRLILNLRGIERVIAKIQDQRTRKGQKETVAGPPFTFESKYLYL
jgi:hypothetical protein